MSRLTETKKNFIAVIIVLIVIYILSLISNYVIDNKPINNKRNVILFRH